MSPPKWLSGHLTMGLVWVTARIWIMARCLNLCGCFSRGMHGGFTVFDEKEKKNVGLHSNVCSTAIRPATHLVQKKLSY